MIGLDEVGRGCWAGPLLAAAVVFNPAQSLPAGLNDSKLLNRRRREILDPIIRAEALAYGIGWVWPSAIDTDGLTAAVKTAMSEALKVVMQQLRVSQSIGEVPGHELDIIIDGSYNFLPDYERTRTIVKADLSQPAVSAASILAKVARDNYMITVANDQYPEYGFANHVGYGTAQHRAALASNGVTPLHRMSYKPILKLLHAAV